MDEMNKLHEEQNDSKSISEPDKNGSTKISIPKWPFIIAGVAVLVAIVVICAAIMLGGRTHEHSFGEWTVIEDPTCISAGIEERICEFGCNEMRRIAPLGHTEAIDEAVAPTCIATGLTEGKHCSVCGIVLVEQDVVPVVAHTYDDDYDAKCNVCGYERDAECAHSYTSVVTAPTCSAKGYTTHTCSACGDSYKDTYTDTIAHTLGDWYVYKDPTLFAKGEERRDCANCNHYESRAGATLNSNYTDPTLIVQNVTVNQGASEVVLEVYLKNNPGIMAMTIQMNIDDNAFSLKKAEKGNILPSVDLTVGNQTSSPYVFLFDAMELTEKDKTDGTLLIITLKVDEPTTLAKGVYNVSFSYTAGDIYNENFDTVDLDTVSGTITVK